MTVDELLKFGYKAEDIRIGTAYFKGQTFFGFLNSISGEFDFRYSSDDMHSVAKVTTIDELKEQEIQYFIKSIENRETLNQASVLYLKLIYDYDYNSPWHPFNIGNASTYPPKKGNYIVSLHFPDDYGVEDYTYICNWAEYADGAFAWSPDIDNSFVIAWAYMPEPFRKAPQ